MTNATQAVYFKGDSATLTGKVEIIHGAVFHEALLVEGHREGELVWIPARLLP